ncbi:MAG: hypothetical protein JXR88_00450 [Clostridia bacterium]|nr:hypothetical protein [Clostridia bacterium]
MSILERIVAHKQEEIKSLLPIQLPKRTCHSLIERMTSREINLIAEIKRGSPSKGLFSEHLNIPNQVSLYNQHASCISVLTDSNFFYGSFDILKEVRHLTDLPILCKDFILSKIQIDYGYAAGADLVLLIARILDYCQLKELLDYAHSLGMEVLIEVESLEDFQKIEDLDFKLCGINHRNLSDFTIDFQKTFDLSPYIQSKGKYVICESGIKNRHDALSLRGYAHGFLMGETLIRNMNIEHFRMLKEKVKVKICGIQTVSDAVSIDGKADYIGLVLCESKRKLTLSEAKEIRKNILKSKVVGVFKGSTVEFIETAFKALNLDFVQIHEEIELKHVPKEMTIYAQTYKDEPGDYPLLLIDNIHPGSGEPYPLVNLEAFANTNYILAGGLHANNVTERVYASHCFAVDVSSGVEIDGIKSVDLIHNFMDIVGGL